jgi:5'-nucleotidase (lipoprotein e(P4) family)
LLHPINIRYFGIEVKRDVMMAKPFLLTICALTLGGCASAPGPKESATPAAGNIIPASLLWYLTAAEKRAIYQQIYAQATERVLARAAALTPGSWTVIADVDETLLDNASYQLFLARSGEKYSEATWEPFVRERRSTALPGSRQFVQRVNAAGGRVVAVTNRTAEICEDTKVNLRNEGLQVAAVLCAPRDPATGKSLSDKNPRFESVRLGTAETGLRPLNVIAWIGDNIKDFPLRSQQSVEPLAEFGDSLFLLPNPMYGSWETNLAP